MGGAKPTQRGENTSSRETINHLAWGGTGRRLTFTLKRIHASKKHAGDVTTMGVIQKKKGQVITPPTRDYWSGPFKKKKGNWGREILWPKSHLTVWGQANGRSGK